MDAVCRAIDQLVKVPNELVEFSIQAVTEGIDALGVVTIRVRQGDLLCSGYSADTDVVVASAQAFVAAINRLLVLSQHPSTQSQPAEAAESRTDRAMAVSS